MCAHEKLIELVNQTTGQKSNNWFQLVTLYDTERDVINSWAVEDDTFLWEDQDNYEISFEHDSITFHVKFNNEPHPVTLSSF